MNVTALANRSFRLMKAPEIETRIVTIVAAIASPETGPRFVLKKGVNFRIS